MRYQDGLVFNTMQKMRDRNKPSIYSIVMFTPIGKQKSDDYIGDDVQGRIFMYLSDHGASTVSDISRDIGVNTNRGMRMIDSMVRKGYLMYSKTGE